MNEKAFTTLEYNKITVMLANKAISAMGKEACLALAPVIELDEITRSQRETSEAVAFVYKKGSLPLGGIKDVRASLKRAIAGGTLSCEDLMGVGEFLRVSRKVMNYAFNDNSKAQPPEETYPIIFELFSRLSAAPSLEGEINRCIINEQTVADDASSKLKSIRRETAAANARVREHLNSVIHSQNYKNALQDAVVTMRNGRFCVPVKAEYRSALDGLVHDQSSTGATLFIEPMAVVTLNNKIKELEAAERDEIEEILRKLSGLVAEREDNLSESLEVLTNLDFIFAKAELSLSMRATEPKFNLSRRVNIKKARHPLLDPETVVPTDIYLGDKFSVLLITGPNTGGKTVSLKTLGLFTLMGQAGLHIPALDESELAVFTDVFADIGDEQSIEQSLSTFSSHMTNIVKILREVTEYSLVLLDELGAGTDPTEGAALAVAIIESIRVKGARAAVTTHYSELKLYALSNPDAENAACEFDVETLKPTYKLLIGIPGKSNAFAISRRLGLPEAVIDAARETLNQKDERFEDVITDLEISKKAAAIEKDRAEQFRREAEILKRDFEKQKEKFDNQRDKIIRDAKAEAAALFESARKEADALLKEMRKAAEAGVSFKELEERRAAIKEKGSAARDEAADLTPKVVIAALTRPPEIGDKVFIHDLNQRGEILTKPDGNGDCTVQAGLLKMKTNVKNLSLDETAPKPSKNFAPPPLLGKSAAISPSLDLRGKMVDEALELLDKYIDDAYLSSLSRVEIIHGKGTGALRAACQDFLKKSPHVKKFRLGEHGEGDTGVTIAELK